MDELEKEAAIARGDYLEEDEIPEIDEESEEEEEEEKPAEEEEDDNEETDDDDKQDEDESDDSDGESEDDDPVEGSNDEDKDGLEDEVDDEDEDKEDDKEDEDGNRIPRSRLNQVIQQRKDKEAALEEERNRSAWLEDQLETLIKQRSAPEEKVKEVPDIEAYDFDDAEDRRDQLLLEGEMKEAGVLRREISREHEKVRQHQLDTMRAEITKEAKTAASTTVSDSNFETVVNKIMTSKDYLDDESDSYNERAVKMANSLMTSYVAEGVDRVKALTQAVEDIAPLFDAKEEEEDKPVLGKKKGKASERDKSARKKAAKASDSTPPDAGRKGSSKSSRDIDSIDIGKMSEKDFGSLTKKERAILRGDAIS